MLRLGYSPGDVDEALVGKQIRRFASLTERVHRSLDFIRSAPPEIQERARALDPRKPLLEWARKGEGRAWEGVDLAAQVLSDIEQIMAPFAGPSADVVTLVLELEAEAQSTRDWLDMRREEHATWVPGLPSWLVGRLAEAERILNEALSEWEKRRLAATVEAVPIENTLQNQIVEFGPRNLQDLSPEEFEILVAEFLDALGLEPIRLGSLKTRDGGIDIIAVPRTIVLPLILAVQVKHHRTSRKTGSPDVRNFAGALHLNALFSAGMLVTNTTFTPDARWVAGHADKLLMLRDQADLKRWIKGEFLRSVEWREIPYVVKLGRGIQIVIPRPEDKD